MKHNSRKRAWKVLWFRRNQATFQNTWQGMTFPWPLRTTYKGTRRGGNIEKKSLGSFSQVLWSLRTSESEPFTFVIPANNPYCEISLTGFDRDRSQQRLKTWLVNTGASESSSNCSACLSSFSRLRWYSNWGPWTKRFNNVAKTEGRRIHTVRAGLAYRAFRHNWRNFESLKRYLSGVFGGNFGVFYKAYRNLFDFFDLLIEGLPHYAELKICIDEDKINCCTGD